MFKLLKPLLLSLIGIGFLCSKAMAINLNIQTPNTDKREFNTNPGTSFLKSGRWFFLSEYNLSANALVMRNKNSGEITPLIKNLVGIDLGLSYGVSDWLQMGLLIPLQMSQGTQSSFIPGGPVVESKIKILNDLVLVPSYQMPMNSQLKISNSNVGYVDEIKLGSPSGSYGAKLVYQLGHVYEGLGVAGQIGYYISPDNKHSYTYAPGQTYTIDQSNTMVMGISGGVPLTSSINAVAELYGAKTPTNFPVEMLGLINIKGKSINWQVGGGTGNVQGSGSNTYKAFLGFTYNFGGNGFSSVINNEMDMPVIKSQRQKEKELEKHKVDQKMTDDNRPIIEGDMEEHSNPDVMDPESSQAPSIPEVPRSSEDSSNE